MKKFNFLILLSLFLLIKNSVLGANIIIIPDTIINSSQYNYYIYPEASRLISQKIANQINTNKVLEAKIISDISELNSLSFKEIREFFNKIKYGNVYDFTTFNKIAKGLGISTIMIVSNNIDIQSEFLHPSILSKLGISGGDAVKPQYLLNTSITVYDAENNGILYENCFKKAIQATNLDLSVSSTAPNYSQISKIQKYSNNLAKNLTPLVEYKVVYKNYHNNDNLPVQPVVAPQFVNDFRQKTFDKFNNFKLKKQNKPSHFYNIEDL